MKFLLDLRAHLRFTPEGEQTFLHAAGQTYRCGQRMVLALADRIGTSVMFSKQGDRDRFGLGCGLLHAGESDQRFMREASSLARADISIGFSHRGTSA